jgi:hypothetical protein
MGNIGRSAGLQTIFSIFLGLMVTAFIGVGAYTFYPPPQKELDRQIQDLNRSEQYFRNARPSEGLTATERQELQKISEERDKLADEARVAREGWGRITSIILIALATLAMAVSLVRSDQLPVISNGLLMGGVFTMIYGVGWIVATDSSVARFIVITVALAITLVLGYSRFVRGKAIPAPSRGQAIAGGEGLAEIQQRVQDLEERMDEAANALGHKGDNQRGS